MDAGGGTDETTGLVDSWTAALDEDNEMIFAIDNGN